MKTTLVLTLAMGLLLAGNPASATEYAAPAQDIMPFSKVIGNVQTRNDFAGLGTVRFDRDGKSYVFTYRTVQGTDRQVMIDALTGEEK